MIKTVLLFITITTLANTAPYKLELYKNPTDIISLKVDKDLSGITYNWIAKEYVTIHQESYCRLDNSLTQIFCGPLDCGDCEDIVFLGLNGAFYEYAIVEEGGKKGSVIIVQSPVSTHNLRFDQIETQKLTYAPTIDGDSGEGIAFNHVTNTFYVCIEAPNKQVLSFTRPNNTNSVSYANNSLAVTEILSTTQLNSIMGNDADLSSCYFHKKTSRLWLMSDTAHQIYDVDLNGNLLAELYLPDNQVEGFTFNHDFRELVIVSEPNNHQIYFASIQNEIYQKVPLLNDDFE